MHYSLAQWFAFLAALCCGLFAGAAIYINAVEHPARMSCGVKVALAQWAPSYRRATVMQASLAIVGFLFALAARVAGESPQVLIAGLILFSVAPYTMLVIMPTNRQLLTLKAEQNPESVAALLSRWNRLHAVRSGLSFIALVLFLLRA
jgi:hypothetical protein